MAKSKKSLALVVQARLASQRVPQKMIRPFAGTTLLDILFTKLRKIKSLDIEDIYISAYDQPIKDIAGKYGFKVFNRSERSALEERDLKTILEWHADLSDQYKYVVMVSACNPLLKVETIDNFIQSFIDSDEPGAFGVIKKKTYYWDKNKDPITDWKDEPGMNTKYVDEVYEAAHCLYASRLDIIAEGYWMCKELPPKLELFVVEELEAFDIDYEWQFRVGEKLYKEFGNPKEGE